MHQSGRPRYEAAINQTGKAESYLRPTRLTTKSNQILGITNPNSTTSPVQGFKTPERDFKMVLVQNWLPPTRENWELVVNYFQYFPLVSKIILRLFHILSLEANGLTSSQFAALQWVISWYGAGKTSGNSILDLPGRWAWITMEVPGFMTLLYIMKTLPADLNLAELPWQNKLMGALFVWFKCLLCKSSS